MTRPLQEILEEVLAEPEIRSRAIDFIMRVKGLGAYDGWVKDVCRAGKISYKNNAYFLRPGRRTASTRKLALWARDIIDELGLPRVEFPATELKEIRSLHRRAAPDRYRGRILNYLKREYARAKKSGKGGRLLVIGGYLPTDASRLLDGDDASTAALAAWALKVLEHG